MKIVLNKCYGGFSLTKAVFAELGLDYDDFGYLDNDDFNIVSDNYLAYRAEPKLIAAIEKIGLKDSTGVLASLEIVNIPDDIDWFIDEYNGIETVHEEHQSW